MQCVRLPILLQGEIRMPDIYDQERGLKISLTDDDYEDYQEGNLSDDFYARRTDGSIANRVDISPLADDDDNEYGEPSNGLDVGSAAKGALTMVAVAGVAYVIAYVIKKLCDRHKTRRAEAEAAQQRETQVDFQEEENVQMAIAPANSALSAVAAEGNNTEQRTLTQEETIQELMKIIVGMAEIADGKKKVSEGIENLSNAGVADRAALLEKLSDPKVLEGVNAYLESNPQLVMQWETILDSIFGRNLIADGQFVPLVISDIERQKERSSGRKL